MVRPLSEHGANRGSIYRGNVRPLLKGYLLFERGSGPLKQRPLYGVLRSSFAVVGTWHTKIAHMADTPSTLCLLSSSCCIRRRS
jgi:hypothetical protein